MKKITLALCGVGAFARRRILPVINKIPQLELVALIDPSTNFSEIPEINSSVRRFMSFEKFYNSDIADLIYITTPNYLHFDQALKSLESSRHVFCEKPIALNSSDCKILIDKAIDLNLQLSVGHMLRFSPAIIFARQALQEGKIGSIERIEITFNYMLTKESRPWAFSRSLSGGGCLIDAGTHCLDLIRFFIEGSFENLHAEMDYASNVNVEREVKCDFTVLNTKCFLNICSDKEYLTSFIIKGDKGVIEIENFAATWDFVSVKVSTNSNKDAFKKYSFDASSVYIEQFNSLLHLIISKEFDYQIAKDAFENIKIIEQLYEMQ
jgi:predicted dehydrogenase